MDQYLRTTKQAMNFDEQYNFEDCIESNEKIFILFEFRYYKVNLPHNRITIRELITFLSEKLKQRGAHIHVENCEYFDNLFNTIDENESVQKYSFNGKYIQILQKIIAQEKDEYLILENEISILQENKNLTSLQKESLRQIIQKRKDIPYLAFPKKDALHTFKVFILGPTNTPYQDGVYELLFTSEIRQLQPTIQVITPIYHRSIKNGQIFIQTQEGQTFDLDKAINSIFYLLKNPPLLEDLDPTSANQYQKTKENYFHKAKLLNHKYAKFSIDNLIKRLTGNVQNQSQQIYDHLQLSFAQLLQTQYFESKNWFDFENEIQNMQYMNKSDKDQPHILKSASLNNFQTNRYNPPNYQLSSFINNTLQKNPGDSKLIQRIKKDINECPISDQKEMFKVFVSNEDLQIAKVIFLGPKNSPFDGGIYQLNLIINQNYPFHPPMCILQTKIFHPNIKNEHISLDRLKENWCISMSIRTLILSIISFLDDPNPNNPLDMECAYVYLENRDTYNQLVEEYKINYASPTIDQLIKQTFKESLDKCDYDYLNILLTEWINYWENLKV